MGTESWGRWRGFAALLLLGAAASAAAALIQRRRVAGGQETEDSDEPTPKDEEASAPKYRERRTAGSAGGPGEPGEEGEPSPRQDGDTDYPAGVWMARLDRVRRFLPRWLYLWIHARLSARFGDEWNWRNRDDRENDEGTPPPDERITWPGVWITEAFLPSTVGSLVAGIERLGWWGPYGDTPVAEVVAEGRSGRGGGWVKLPLLRRRSSRPSVGLPTLERELPDGVEYVTGQIRFVTPSLTVLVAGFRFESAVSAASDAALRRRYRTYHLMTGRTGSRVMSPTFQRRDAVRGLERRYVDGCRRWLDNRLAGYFASGDQESEAPATLMLTTQLVVPFEQEPDDRFWMHEAGIGFAVERWETGIDALRYAFRPHEDGVAMLAGCERDIFSNPEYWRSYGAEPSTWHLAYRVESNLAGLMAFRTADAVLWDVRRRLGGLRDSLAELAASRTRRQLSSVQRQLGTMGSDVTAITSEILRWPERPSRVSFPIFPTSRRLMTSRAAPDATTRSRYGTVS